MSEVVTSLVIDAETTGADQFSNAMNSASSSAQQGVNSATAVSLAIAGVGVAVIGAVAGLRSFVDYAGAQSQALVDIATHADMAGVSAKEFQQIMFAAMSAGVSDKNFSSGLDKIGADLVQAGEGATQFGKLFEANGIAIKDTNGQLISTKAAVGDIMSLVQNASPQVAAQIIRIAGLTADWIPFLKESADQFAAQKQAAADLGVVIDDSTIAKAQEFNTQWKTAVATWDLQFKASLASILPLLTELATLASTVISSIGSATGSVGRWTTPDDQKTSSQLADQIDDVMRLRDLVQSFGSNAGGLTGFKIGNLANLVGLPSDASIQQIDGLIDKLSALYDKKPTQVVITGNSTKLPDNSPAESNDFVDRAINQLNKHIETQKADTLAVGLGDAALAGFKATAAETAAVQANGGAETADQATKFALLKQAAIDAAGALAQAKVASNAQFGTNTSFLGAGDLAIATQLKTVYGNDVTAALNSADAAQLRFNAGAKELSTAIENDLVTGLTDIVDGTKSAGQGFNDLAAAVAKSVEQMVIKVAVIEPLMKAMQASISGSGILSFLTPSSTALPGTASSPFFGPVAPSAHGNVFDGVSRFAGGGAFTNSIVDSPTLFKFASGTGLMGEAGPEAIMPLKRGADGSLGVMAGGGSAPQINVTLIETPNGGGGTTQKQNANGGIDIEVAIAQITAKSAATPGAPLNRVLTDQLGSRQRLASR